MGRRKGSTLRLSAVASMIMLMLLASAGCKLDREESQKKSTRETTTEASKKSKKNTGQIAKPKTQTVNVYFSDQNAEYLIPEQREIPDSPNAVENTLQELIKGPKEEGHLATIPEGTEVEGVDISDELVAVNFSRAFVDNHPGGSASELMTVYSVVNSVTEVAGVNSVEFLVEGQALESLAGHLDLTQPVERDDSLIRR